ncbi:MAG: aminoglycoside 6-adenylyltransferase [Oscillospiraceae bacterium]|nr:aminoglycoside 6-adenylyltransferase [Oscillospiraceae bacterium]
MRTEEEMFGLFHRIAAEDDRIRVMTLEGSRVNSHIKPDIWQDYDITFLVRDMESYLKSDDWLSAFGDIVFLQKPEAQALFPPDFPEGWFSYLMLFADGTKIDLTIIKLELAEEYFHSDPLIRVILDKDGIAPDLPEPTDDAFRIQCPSEEYVTDCANEFYFSSTYVQRAIFREEVQVARQLFESRMRQELLRMLTWLAGARQGFPVNTGKYCRWLSGFLTKTENGMLEETYCLRDLGSVEKALYSAMDLFGKSLAEVCSALGYRDPGYHDTVKGYIRTLKEAKKDKKV